MIRSLSQVAMVASLFATAGIMAQANELDNENQFSAEQAQTAAPLPKTVVIRVKIGTQQAEVLQSNEALGKDADSKKFVSSSSFIKVDAKGKPLSELDRNSSTSSFGFGGFRGGFGGGRGFRGGFGGGRGFGGGFGRGFGGGFYPRYNYGGFNYGYAPYNSYIDNGYQYQYYCLPYAGYNPYCPVQNGYSGYGYNGYGY